MTTALIVRDDTGSSIAFTAEALALKESALESSALIALVRNEDDQAVAVDAQRMIKSVLDAAEAARVKLKEPILEAGRELDARVKAFTAELKEEYLRLSTRIGDYQQEQLMIAKRAEMERAIELRKIEEEKEAALKKARDEAEAADMQRKLELKRIEKGKFDAAAIQATQKLAEAAAKDSDRLAAETVRQEELAAQKMEMLKPVPIPARVDGQNVRQPWRWELTNIDLLYKMHPGLVTIKENAREINETIMRLAEINGKPEIKGLRIWQETVSGVRLGRERKAIDV